MIVGASVTTLPRFGNVSHRQSEWRPGPGLILLVAPFRGGVIIITEVGSPECPARVVLVLVLPRSVHSPLERMTCVKA